MFVAKSKTVETFLQGSTTAWAKTTTTTTTTTTTKKTKTTAKSKTVETFLQGLITAWAKTTTTTILDHQNRFEIAMKIKLDREELHCSAFAYFTNLGR